MPGDPDVIEMPCAPAELHATIEQVVRQWTSGVQRCCSIEDIVIMGIGSKLATQLPGIQSIAGFPLIDYDQNAPRGHLRYIGIHRAKGLDFLGVILVGLPSPANLAASGDIQRQESFFHGATWARQLPAVLGHD